METKNKPESKPEAGCAKIPVQRLVIPLLPCPFCGCETASLVDERNIVVLTDLFAARHCVMECDNCGARGAGVMCSSKSYELFDDMPNHAVEKWNQRINATETWNKAAELPNFLQTNAVWGALRELKSMGAISIDSLA